MFVMLVAGAEVAGSSWALVLVYGVVPPSTMSTCPATRGSDVSCYPAAARDIVRRCGFCIKQPLEFTFITANIV